MLDSDRIPCNWRKFLSLFPLSIVYMLISYISYNMLWVYVPKFLFKEDPYCFTAIMIRVIFSYFAGMTYLYLTMTFLTNPGYLPRWLRDINIDPTTDPYRTLRIYNMRVWIANKLYLFEEFLEKEDGISL